MTTENRRCLLLVLAVWLIHPAHAATVSGRVMDATTGEPLTKVRVALAGSSTVATTDESGRFRLDGLAAGPHRINVTAAGYGLMTRSVNAAESSEVTLELALHADADIRRDAVNVTAGPFETTEANAASEKTLSKLELQALSMVLLADPLRTLQALPGAVASNDLRAEFSVRGAGYDRVALFVDGVLTDNFVHAANLGIGGGSASEKLSLATINADTVAEASLFSGAFPSKIGDSSAAAISLETRQGNRVRPGTRVAIGLLGLSGVTDGPLRGGRGSWLLAGRTSYADYLQRFVERLTGTGDRDNAEDASLNFSDVQGKFVYDLTSRHQVGVSVIAGLFTVSQKLQADVTELDRFNYLDSRNAMVNGFWRYAPSGRTLWTNRVFGTFAQRNTKIATSFRWIHARELKPVFAAI